MTRREARYGQIVATGRYLPEREISNDQLRERFAHLEGLVDKLEASTGIRRRWYAPEDWAASDLAVLAARQALARAGRAPEDVDLILVGTDSPDFMTPATSVVVQHKLGAKRAGTFDIGCACASFPTALATAAAWIASNPSIQTVLVIGVYLMHKLADPNDPMIFFYGDGAGAAVLEATAEPGFVSAAAQADGSYNHYWGIFAGGSAEPATEDAVRAGRTRVQFLERYPPTVNEEGWPRLVRQLAENGGFALAELDQVIFSQVRKSSIELAMDALGLPRARAHTVMEEWGYTGSACLGMAFDDAVQKGIVGPGDLVAFVGSGVGYNQAGAVFRIGELPPMITADVLGERARLTPDALALVVVDPPLRLTYGELDQRAVRCAAAWRALGLAPGDRVAILAHNRVEYLDAFFAAGKSGSILVPLGTRLTPHELAPILEDAEARLVLYDGAFADTIAQLRPRVPGVERWVALDEPVAADDSRYSVLLAAADLASYRPARCAPEDVYCLLYTSGTTGRPKGVMIPHRMVAWNGYNTVCGWQLSAADVAPIFTPLYHAGGLMAFLVPIFTIGGTIVLHQAFDAAEVWGTIERERCTVVLGVPTIWKLLLEAPELETTDLSSLRWLISGGAPLPTWIAEAYQRRGVAFLQGFGMTEVGVNCFAMTVEDAARKSGSIGKPMMHTEVRLVDGGGAEVATGEVGEMWFSGAHVSLGYWQRPEVTAEAYCTDQRGATWFRSGDLARRDEEGFFYVAGRAKEMFISGGVNVYPAEIEAVLLQHPGVLDAAVVAVEHPTWGEVGVAFVVEVGPGTAPDSTVLEFLGERLARFKIPRDVVHLDQLPRTAYGKVVKGDLALAYRAEHAS